MSTKLPDRFLYLAIMKIDEEASEAELTELRGLMAVDASLEEEYKRLVAEGQLLKEIHPDVEAIWEFDSSPEPKPGVLERIAAFFRGAETSPEPTPVTAMASDMRPVRTLASPESNFWQLAFGVSAVCAVALLVFFFSRKNPAGHKGPNAITVAKDTSNTPPTTVANKPARPSFPIIQLATLNVKNSPTGSKHISQQDLETAFDSRVRKLDATELTNVWLKMGPPDPAKPVVKIYYEETASKLWILGQIGGKTFKRSFNSENDPDALKKAKAYLDNLLTSEDNQ